MLKDIAEEDKGNIFYMLGYSTGYQNKTASTNKKAVNSVAYQRGLKDGAGRLEVETILKRHEKKKGMTINVSSLYYPGGPSHTELSRKRRVL